ARQPRGGTARPGSPRSGRFIRPGFLLASRGIPIPRRPPMIPFAADAQCPLDGIVVLDLSRLVAGNMLSLQLADFGAEVIKIEDPRKGDPLRDWRVKDVSVHWKVYARNKKSVTLNLRAPEGLDLLRKLVATANVFIENFRPGTLEEMGIGPDALHAINRQLILVR